MRFVRGGRGLERLAGGGSPAASERVPSRWATARTGADPWTATKAPADPAWLRGRGGGAARAALQEGLLFPAARAIARPRVSGADELAHAPQPAIIAANHASDLDTPLILAALPRSWRARTFVGAASDRFYRRRRYAIATTLWIGTFPFDRSAGGRGLARAAALLDDGRNVLLYPQATRTHGLEGFRTGVARLALAAGVPVVPAHVAGTALLMPKDRGLIQRGSTRVAFGRPVYPAPGEDPRALAERVSGAIAALGDAALRPQPRRARVLRARR